MTEIIDPIHGRAALGGRARMAAPWTTPLERALTPPDGEMHVGVYLAGKITKNGWRSDLVPGLKEAGGDQFFEGQQRGLMLDEGIQYMGPFFVSCDHGCAHGKAMHALLDGTCIYCVQGAGWTYKHGGDREAVRDVAAQRCLEQIERSDIVIALIADDAHGTLVEVGYAAGIGRRVITTNLVDCGCTGSGVEMFSERDDTDQVDQAWFPHHLPQTTYVCCVSGALARLRKIMSKRLEPDESSLCESPVELAFLRSMRSAGCFPEFKPNVTVMDGKYRIDFADVDRKIGVEIDGHAYHSDKESFAKDRVRQRALEVSGWRIVRYSGQEVHRDSDACVLDFAKWLAATS